MADSLKDRQGEPSMPSHKTHPFVDRFRMIRESMPSTAVQKNAPSPIQEFTTHAVELVRQSCRKNSSLPPPPYIVDDLFQADIDGAFGEGTSIFIDRSCVYISPQGDVGFLAGPTAFDRLVFAAILEPAQYIFRVDKSRKGIDGLGAWSLASATLPPIERHEAIYERLADNVKDVAEGPIKCTPIVFRGFSDKAREKLLELALDPFQRTLPPVDVYLEDGVPVLPRLKDDEEEPEWEGIRAVTPPSPASPSRGGHGTDEEEQEAEEGDVPVGNEQSDELGRDNAERNRPLQINYDIPPAPMPSAVDPSVFEGFDPVLPPEPDTPSDNAKSPNAPPTPKPEDQQSHRTAPISSPSAIRALFSPSNGVQSKYEEENEFDRNSVRNARRELAIPEGVRSDTVTENLSVPLPAASAPGSGSNFEAPLAGATLQSGSANGEDLWPLIAKTAFSLSQQVTAALAARTPSGELPVVPIAAQDAAAGAPLQLPTPPNASGTAIDAGSSANPEPPTVDGSRSATVPTMPAQGPISNQEPQPELTAQPASRSSRKGPEGEPPAPGVGAHAPQREPTPVSNVPPETGSVQHLPPPMPAGPSTPAGNRRARLSPTPPSAEAERHPPKRTRGEGSGDEGEGREGVQPSLPIPPPIFENNNAGSSHPPITQPNGETPSTIVQQPHPGDGQPTTLQDQQNVTTTGNPEGGSSHSSQLPATSSSNMSNFQSGLAQDAETDPDTSMESAPTSGPSAKGKAKAISPNVGQDSYLVSSPRPMEWDPEGHSPHIPAASPESKPERERRAAEAMDFEVEAPLASGSGVGQASMGRPIKPLRPARRGLSRVTPGYRCGPSIQPDPKSPTSRLELPCSKNTSEDIVMTGGPGIPTGQTSPDGNTTNVDRSIIPPMSEVTDSGLPDRSDEQSFASALPENQPETSDDESDLSDYLEEAKASNYCVSNAIAAAAIENELEEASDSEGCTPTPPMYPAEHGASHLHVTTLAFGLHSARGGNVGARSVARLGDLPSIFSTWSISGPSNVGDSTDASPVNGEEIPDQNSAGGAADDGEEEEDIFPLI